MTFDDATVQLAGLLRKIDDEGITVITEDCGQIFLMRGKPDDQEFSDINDHSGRWDVEK